MQNQKHLKNKSIRTFINLIATLFSNNTVEEQEAIQLT